MTWPTLRTYIAPTTQVLLRHLRRSLALPATSVNLFALSAQADDLQDAVSYLTALPNAIGALTASSTNGVQLAVASYPAASCFPFRSTIPGVPQAEVGRIRTYRPPTDGDRASEARLEKAIASGGTNWGDALSESGSLELPLDLQHIRNKSNISSFLYLSDGAPEGLLYSLHRHFPTVGQLGLVASSTPFITGRPVTLFKGSNIFSDGAVGLALYQQGAHETTIEFDNVQAVSPPMEVTQAQTNMVETLDYGNPVESLLLAMKSQGSINKEQDIYLGVIEPSSRISNNNEEVFKYSRIHKITAGGPSRGTLLLDATEGPQAGAKVQFVITGPSQQDPKPLLLSQLVPTISLTAISDSDTRIATYQSTVQEIENVFVGTSENGFLVGSPSANISERPWICNIPGARLMAQWNRR